MCRLFLAVLISGLLLSACQPAPYQGYQPGDLLLQETFDDPSTWETFQQPGMSLAVVDGGYHIDNGPGGFLWGLNDQLHNDVVIEVQARQLSEHRDNAYGVMCRANPENTGEGYYFLISGDGYWSIGRGNFNEMEPLIEWRRHNAVRQGAAENTLRAVCLGNNLIFYVNGTYVGEYFTSTYSEGVAGFAAAANAGGDISVVFDNLMIYEALPAE